MSKSVDQRVVEMRFDNAQFESATKTTMSTLDKLKAKLKLDGASKGLDDVASAAKRVDMNPISAGLEAVKVKFSALQVIGVTALANLTNSAVNFGKQIISTLTNSVVQGGITRAMNIEQAKFQLEGLGIAWEAVSDDIDYAVKGTAYGMDVAAKAASQLSASGVQTGDSMKTALRGISGLAAMTNSQYEDISRIFTQVAGQGRVMSNDLLQISSRGINAAAALGKYLNKSEAEIREMVSKGQIDFATFAAAMDDAFGEHAKEANKTFTGALSNMKAALARIGADVASESLIHLRDVFNELRVVFDDIHDELKPVIEGINNLQKAAKEATVEFLQLGGLQAILKGIGNVFAALGSIAKPVIDAFKQIFPPASAAQLADMAKKFEELTAKLKLSESAQAKVKSAFAGFFSVIKMGVFVVEALAKVFTTFILPIFTKVGSIVLSAAGAVGEFVAAIGDGVPSANSFQDVLDGIKQLLSPLVDLVNNVTGAIAGFFDGIRNGIASFREGNPFQKVADGFSNLQKIIAGVMGPLSQAIKNFFKPLTDMLSNLGSSTASINWGTIFATGSLAGIMVLINKFVNSFDKLFGSVEDLLGSIKNTFSGEGGIVAKLTGVFDVFQAYQNQLNSQAIRNIAISIGILAASMYVLASIPSDKVNVAVVALGSIFAELAGAMTVLQLVSKKFAASNGSLVAMSASMIAMAAAVAILAGALKKVSDIDTGSLAKGVAAIAALAGIMVGMTKLTSMISDTSGMFKMAAAMVVYATAIRMLVSSVEKLGAIDAKGLVKGLGGVAVMMTMMIGMMKAFDTMDNAVGKGGLKAAASILVISAAIAVLGHAVGTFAAMDLGGMVQGLVGVATSLGIMVIALNNLKFDSKGTTQLIIAAAALVILAKAVEAYANIPLTSLAKGLIALGTSLAILVVGLNLMNGTVAGSAALLVAAAALNLLVPVISALGALPIANLVQGLVALGAAMALMSVAGYALAGAVPGMLGLGAALALIGASVFLVGTGIAALAIGIAGLAASGVAGAMAFVTSIQIILTGLLQMIPLVAQAAVQAIAAFVVGLAENAGQILSALASLVVQILETLSTLIPQLIDFGLQMVLALLQGLASNMRQIVSAALELISNFLLGLADGIPMVIQAGAELVISFINGVADGIRNNAAAMRDAMVNLATSLIDAFCIVLGIQSPSTVMEEKGGNIVEGIINGILNFLGSALETIGQLAQGLVDTVVGFMSNFLQAGADFIVNMITGIGSMIGNIISTIVSLVQNVLTNIINFMGNFLSAGRDFVVNLISGIQAMLGNIINTIISLVQNVLTNIINFMGNFLQAGRDFISNMISGIQAMLGSILGAIRGVIQSAVSTVVSFMGNFLQAGRDFINNIVSGVNALASNVLTAVSGAIQGAINNVGSVVSQFLDVGKNIVNGIIDGINSIGSGIADALGGIVNGAVDGVKKLLGIASPSKVFRAMGRFVDEGLILGLKDYSGKVEKQTKSVAGIVVDAFSVDSDISPVIKPVVDLSDVNNKSSRIRNLLSSGTEYSVGLAAQVSGQVEGAAAAVDSFNDVGNTVVNNNFVQNNYSPKALDRLSIYRQTKNQFAMAKGALS